MCDSRQAGCPKEAPIFCPLDGGNEGDKDKYKIIDNCNEIDIPEGTEADISNGHLSII